MLRHLAGTLLVAAGGAASAHTFEIGSVSVPGACVVSDFPNRAALPWQSPKQNLIKAQGKQMVSLLVFLDRPEDAQTPSEQRAIERCAQRFWRDVPVEQRSHPTIELEKSVARQINSCLKQESVELIVRFASFRTGPIQCPDGQPK